MSPPPMRTCLPSPYRYGCEKATGMAKAKSTLKIPVRLREPEHYEGIPDALIPHFCPQHTDTIARRLPIWWRQKAPSAFPVRLRDPERYEAIPGATVRPLVSSHAGTIAAQWLQWQRNSEVVFSQTPFRHWCPYPGQFDVSQTTPKAPPRCRLWTGQDHHGCQGPCMGPAGSSWRPQSTRINDNTVLGSWEETEMGRD